MPDARTPPGQAAKRQRLPRPTTGPGPDPDADVTDAPPPWPIGPDEYLIETRRASATEAGARLSLLPYYWHVQVLGPVLTPDGRVVEHRIGHAFVDGFTERGTRKRAERAGQRIADRHARAAASRRSSAYTPRRPTDD